MTKKERMMAAIAHKEPDKVPKGEQCCETGKCHGNVRNSRRVWNIQLVK